MVRRRVVLVWSVWTALVLSSRLRTAHGDFVFRVPEVLARPVSISKAVGVGSLNATRSEPAPARAGWRSDSEPESQYEEYFVEHDVSTADARAAARLLNLDDIPVTRVGCGPCSRRELEYCESRVLSDHCCCERQFLPEPFPWLPHTCYVGPHRCRPLARDCTKYARLRDCCCLRRLAERWKSLLSGGERARASPGVLLGALLIISAARLAASSPRGW